MLVLSIYVIGALSAQTFFSSSFIESEQKLEKKEIVELVAEIKILSGKIKQLEKKIDDSSH